MEHRIDSAQLLSQVTPQPAKVHKGQNPEKLKEAAQQFEAIFIQQMYKEMRKTIPDDGLIQRGNADDIYTQLQDLEAAKVTAQQGGIGLADLMMQQLVENQ
ncbi:MAG: rod-binding protein [Desulfuromusa sp.]|nr:rod-binding protein [Desulfuromusa sp.]